MATLWEACDAADALAAEMEQRAARIREFTEQVRGEYPPDAHDEVPTVLWNNLHDRVLNERERFTSTRFFSMKCINGAAGR